MNATLVEYANGTLEFVVCENQKNGFTNHRVTITTGQALTSTDSRYGQHTWQFQDVAAMRYHLHFGICLACPFLSQAYREAFDHVSTDL